MTTIDYDDFERLVRKNQQPHPTRALPETDATTFIGAVKAYVDATTASSGR